MSEFGSDFSGLDVSGDNGTSEVSEVETGTDVSESEMDEDLSNELDDSYDMYMNDAGNESLDSDVEADEENNDWELDEDDESYDLELNETDESDNWELDEDADLDDLDAEIDSKYNEYISDEGGSSFEIDNDTESSENPEELDSDVENQGEEADEQQLDNAEDTPEQIKCRNESLEGQEHPETGVPFERRQVDVDGKQCDVVVPVFESSYDAQLPGDLYEAPDRTQFKECNAQLKDEISKNPELREQFDEEQLEQIEDGETPEGYTWHHDAEAGKMQLVGTDTHQRTGHTGGRSIWGGGTDNRQELWLWIGNM